MILFILSYLGGVLTIASPCILPVLPFVFARADRPFVRSGLPMLAGMAVVFAAVASLAAVAGSWAVAANQYGRWVAIALMAAFGLTLLFPSLGDRAMRPLVALGARLSPPAMPGRGQADSSFLSSLLLGGATGLLWAPCAGPVLGLILTGAALNGANAETSLLLLAYAAGAATSLALALLVGGRVFTTMKRSLGAGEWLRRGLGAAVLVAVAAIALGLDTGFLTRVSLSGTASLEQKLLDRFQSGDGGRGQSQSASDNAGEPGATALTMSGARPGAPAALPVEGSFPSLAGAVEWLNSPPLTPDALKGKVVLIDFWTYSCINCLRAIPYVRAWAEKYRDQGLVVIGVHSPEFAFEKDIANVRKAIADLGIVYPVAIDNDFAVWRAFDNKFWPAHYFIDAEGRVRYRRFGEGRYAESERVIQELLAEAGKARVATDIVSVSASGAEAASNAGDVKSPETYVGYSRAANFVSPGGAARDAARVYSLGTLGLNQWGLAGDWTIARDKAVLNGPAGRIAYRFHARDLHLVLGPSPDGKPVRFRVTLDGQAPGGDRGSDVDAAGFGSVTSERLYQLVRQAGPVADRAFEIEFLDPGARAYAFTFG